MNPFAAAVLANMNATGQEWTPPPLAASAPTAPLFPQDATSQAANVPFGPPAPPPAPPPEPPPTPSQGSYADWAKETGIMRSAEQMADRGEVAPGVDAGGVAAKVAPPAPPGAMRPEAPPIVAVGGGYIPAHEASRLGPTQWAALGASNAAAENAIGNIAGRSVEQANQEAAMYAEQARQSQLRQDAATSAALEREADLRMRQQDFDQSAKDLASQGIDSSRVWASKSTPRKIAALVSVGLGGFLSGARGGPNQALDMINTEIERDIRSQEFAYKAKRDSLEAQQSAFGMAMQRYQSVDAAKAFARVAAMDTVAAEIQRQAALKGGNDAMSRADAAIAELQKERAQQILQGIQFVPTQYSEQKYRIAGRLGTYSAREIDAMQDKEAERGFELEKIAVKEGLEGAGKRADQEQKREARWVPTSSTGKGYYAPTEDEAKKHREAQAETQEIIDLVKRIKEDQAKIGYSGRVAASTGLPGTETPAVKRLRTNSTALVGAINKSQHFGALDKGTQELLQQMTGDPLAVMGNEPQLEAIERQAFEKRREIEKSSTGSKPSLAPEGSKRAAW